MNASMYSRGRALHELAQECDVGPQSPASQDLGKSEARLLSACVPRVPTSEARRSLFCVDPSTDNPRMSRSHVLYWRKWKIDESLQKVDAIRRMAVSSDGLRQAQQPTGIADYLDTLYRTWSGGVSWPKQKASQNSSPPPSSLYKRLCAVDTPFNVPHFLNYSLRCFFHASMSYRTSSASPLPERNEVNLTRDLLLGALHDLSIRLATYFPSTVRLVVHGGAVMVLHPQLACRDMTRDIDYLHRSFEAEWMARGLSDAGPRLITCIKATARAFDLGADWMNACADVALPMSRDTFGKPFDPISYDALSANNVKMNTIFTSPGLVLVGVSWSWAVALKLVRYEKHDPHDIASILRLGHRQRNVKWTRTLLEQWLVAMCSAMNYNSYTPYQMETTRQKMRHAIALAYQQNIYPPQPQRAIYAH